MNILLREVVRNSSTPLKLVARLKVLESYRLKHNRLFAAGLPGCIEIMILMMYTAKGRIGPNAT